MAPVACARASILIPAILRAERNRSPNLFIMIAPPLVDKYHNKLLFVNLEAQFQVISLKFQVSSSFEF
jgi:hypothetical protein